MPHLGPLPPLTSWFAFAVCQVGAEGALKAEVARLRPSWRLAFSRPGLLTFKSPDQPVDAQPGLEAVFARVHGASVGPVRSLEELHAAVRKVVPAGLPVRLHVFERDVTRPGEEPPGFTYGELAKSVDATIRAGWGGAAMPLLEGELARDGELVLDVVTARDEPWWVGFHRHGPGSSPHPGGRIPLAPCPQAPSRAYFKMQEALQWSGAPLLTGDHAVELGSAPGGAALALVQHGVHVHGVDPGAMDPAVLAFQGPGGARVDHLRMPMGQLERSVLPPALNWVVMDVNLAPTVALRTVERMCGAPRTALMGVMLTFKLDHWKAAHHIPQLLHRVWSLGMARVRATQLPSNRMEWFACGLTGRGVGRLVVGTGGGGASRGG